MKVGKNRNESEAKRRKRLMRETKANLVEALIDLNDAAIACEDRARSEIGEANKRAEAVVEDEAKLRREVGQAQERLDALGVAPGSLGRRISRLAEERDKAQADELRTAEQAGSDGWAGASEARELLRQVDPDPATAVERLLADRAELRGKLKATRRELTAARADAEERVERKQIALDGAKRAASGCRDELTKAREQLGEITRILDGARVKPGGLAARVGELVGRLEAAEADGDRIVDLLESVMLSTKDPDPVAAIRKLVEERAEVRAEVAEIRKWLSCLTSAEFPRDASKPPAEQVKALVGEYRRALGSARAEQSGRALAKIEELLADAGLSGDRVAAVEELVRRQAEAKRASDKLDELLTEAGLPIDNPLGVIEQLVKRHAGIVTDEVVLTGGKRVKLPVGLKPAPRPTRVYCPKCGAALTFATARHECGADCGSCGWTGHVNQLTRAPEPSEHDPNNAELTRHRSEAGEVTRILDNAGYPVSEGETLSNHVARFVEHVSAQLERKRVKLRAAAQALIEEIGATGPETVVETARRAADAIRKLRGDVEHWKGMAEATDDAADGANEQLDAIENVLGKTKIRGWKYKPDAPAVENLLAFVGFAALTQRELERAQATISKCDEVEVARLKRDKADAEERADETTMTAVEYVIAYDDVLGFIDEELGGVAEGESLTDALERYKLAGDLASGPEFCPRCGLTTEELPDYVPRGDDEDDSIRLSAGSIAAYNQEQLDKIDETLEHVEALGVTLASGTIADQVESMATQFEGAIKLAAGIGPDGEIVQWSKRGGMRIVSLPAAEGDDGSRACREVNAEIEREVEVETMPEASAREVLRRVVEILTNALPRQAYDGEPEHAARALVDKLDTRDDEISHLREQLDEARRERPRQATPPGAWVVYRADWPPCLFDEEKAAREALAERGEAFELALYPFPAKPTGGPVAFADEIDAVRAKGASEIREATADDAAEVLDEIEAQLREVYADRGGSRGQGVLDLVERAIAEIETKRARQRDLIDENDKRRAAFKACDEERASYREQLDAISDICDEHEIDPDCNLANRVDDLGTLYRKARDATSKVRQKTTDPNLAIARRQLATIEGLIARLGAPDGLPANEAVGWLVGEVDKLREEIKGIREETENLEARRSNAEDEAHESFLEAAENRAKAETFEAAFVQVCEALKGRG